MNVHIKTHTQASTSKIETLLQSESEYETDTDEDDDDDEEERMKPIFIPKAKRETIKEQELKLEESKLREEKKVIIDENRKRQVGQLSVFALYMMTISLPYKENYYHISLYRFNRCK